MCASNLHILNGRAFGDIFGKHTCFQYNGNSVVDYCIVSESLFRNVLFFHVQELKPLLNDHAVITTKLYAKYRSDQRNVNTKCINMPQTYVWNEESSFLFSKALGSKCTREKISSVLNYSYSDNVAKALTAFNDIIDAGRKIALRKKVNIKGKKIIPKKKWFDDDLQSLHKELVRKSGSYSKHPDDPVIGGSFFKFRKMYSQVYKQKKRALKRNSIAKLDKLSKNEPSEYWKLVKIDEVSPDIWISHFTKLCSIKY